jgi:hypothetical protein
METLEKETKCTAMQPHTQGFSENCNTAAPGLLLYWMWVALAQFNRCKQVLKGIASGHLICHALLTFSHSYSIGSLFNFTGKKLRTNPETVEFGQSFGSTNGHLPLIMRKQVSCCVRQWPAWEHFFTPQRQMACASYSIYIKKESRSEL